MKRFFYVIINILICFLNFGFNPMQHELSDKEKIADRITANTAKKLKKEKNLLLIGTGGGMLYQIDMLAMSFCLYQEVDLTSARDLIVFAVNEYLTAINKSQDIRPYLDQCPFTAKNVEIRIFVHGPGGCELPPGKIDSINCIEGVVKYRHSSDLSRPIHKETYDEALSKIGSCPAKDKKA